MRLATKDRFIIGHLRAGEFYPDPSWDAQGVKIHKCTPSFNNSITNTDFTKKFAIEVQWRVFRNLGAVQLLYVTLFLFLIFKILWTKEKHIFHIVLTRFSATIMQEQAVYWAKWSPLNGFLLPETSMGRATHPKSLAEGVKPENQFVVESGRQEKVCTLDI